MSSEVWLNNILNTIEWTLNNLFKKYLIVCKLCNNMSLMPQMNYKYYIMTTVWKYDFYSLIKYMYLWSTNDE